MSLYRCAACGSPNVVTDTEKEGYSFAKGAVGTVLLGVGGAAAGINGKSKTVYKCPDCGTTLSYSMPFEMKTLIDMGVMSEKVRDNLELNGVKIDWITLTSKYKNIESSSFVATSTQPVQATNVAPQVADKVVENNTLSEEGKNANREKYETAKREYKKAHEKWEDECFDVKEKREALISEELANYETKMKNEIEQDIKNSDSNYKKASAEINSKIKKAETDLAGLGFFKFKEKKQLKNDLINLENQKATLSANHTSEQSSLNTQLNKISELSKSNKAQIQKKIEKKLPFPKMPDMPKELFVYNKVGEDIGGGGLVYHAFAMDIRESLAKKGRSTIPEIQKGCPILADMTEKRITVVMDILVSINEVNMVELGTRKSYSINYNEWQAKQRKEAPHLAEEYIEKYKPIVAVLKKHKRPVTITEIKEECPEYSNLELTKICRKLTEVSLVKRTEDSRKVFFEWTE